MGGCSRLPTARAASFCRSRPAPSPGSADGTAPAPDDRAARLAERNHRAPPVQRISGRLGQSRSGGAPARAPRATSSRAGVASTGEASPRPPSSARWPTSVKPGCAYHLVSAVVTSRSRPPRGGCRILIVASGGPPHPVQGRRDQPATVACPMDPAEDLLRRVALNDEKVLGDVMTRRAGPVTGPSSAPGSSSSFGSGHCWRSRRPHRRCGKSWRRRRRRASRRMRSSVSWSASGRRSAWPAWSPRPRSSPR